ncbi:MAG: OB-fold nucleic acid binding domain-containing protein, partial [Actinobacteria bacterium]|nr:OB-fold nucleic acid binding domain-containing protein [Actinomycetota bacterium]
VAEDSFLPRWMSRRGHRLVFSNGIVVLTVLAVALLLVVGASTNSLVPFYAIGVFTGFAMAGFGMVRYHLREREPAWRRRLVINFVAGVYAALVVLIFAIVKFTEGAWLVVVVFPVGVFGFIRLNRRYRSEAAVLQRLGERKAPSAPPNFARRSVLVLVDELDLATVAALRYARGLRPTSLRAVHFVLDDARADVLREQWLQADQGTPLDLVEVPDRRLVRAAAELVAREAADPGTYVTVVLPRRGYSPLLGRFLHDRTADKIARVVSRVPRSAATIIPFDVAARLELLDQRQAKRAARAAAEDREVREHEHPAVSPGVTPIGSLTSYGKATVAGRVHSIEIRPIIQTRSCVLACTVADATGELTALFYGRTQIPGLHPGSKIMLRGPAGVSDGSIQMINPAYELIQE